MAKQISFVAGILLVFLASAFGHSYLTQPTSRTDQKQTESGCRGPACLGPCDTPLASAKTPAVTVQRGVDINPQWPRNNHAGGFIRFAWTQTSGSDVAANFDAGVQQIVCHEVGGCKPDDPTDPNGGDSAPADGSFQPCQVNLTVPLYLTNGAWTFQWAWFGGAFALGDYYSCVDYIISGGPTGSQPAPVYIGGDYTYPGQSKCKFFNTDRLHECVDEPCSNPIYPPSQEESGPAFGIAAGNPSSGSANTGTTGIQTTGVQTTGTTGIQTTGVQTTGTTGIQTTGTTGIQTTGVKTTGAKTTGTRTTGTKTTGAKTTGTKTGAATTTTGNGGLTGFGSSTGSAPSGNTNCAGYTTLSASTATIVSVDAWSDQFRIVISLTAAETVLTNWMIQVVWPSNAVDTQVVAVYNAGQVKCSANFPAPHIMLQPVANWANNLPAGSTVDVEVLATNTNMGSSFIQANTQIRVYTA